MKIYRKYTEFLFNNLVISSNDELKRTARSNLLQFFK